MSSPEAVARAVPSGDGDRVPRVVTTTSVALLVGLALGIGRDLWFFSDDWNIVAQFPSGRLLEPFNSHLSLVPVGVYQALFHTVGLGSYLPYRVVGLAAYVLLGAAVWRYGRARAGGWAAAWATVAVLWGSGGVTNVMFPFLMNFSIPVAAVAAIWWHLDRGSGRDEIWASVWLAVALATSGLGLLAAAAVGVELVATRAPMRRWATMAPGPLLWGLWFLARGVDAPANGGLGEVVPYAARMLLGGFVALGGGSTVVGVVLGAGFAALLVVAATRWHTLDGRALGALAAAGAFAGLTAWSRTGVVPAIAPDELRYRWTIAAFVVLTVVSVLPRHLGGSRARLVGSAAAVLVVVGAAALVDDMVEWADMVAGARPGLEAAVVATEAGDTALDRDRVIPLSFVAVHVGELLDAVDELGSPVAGIDVSAIGGRDDQRRAADGILADAVSARAERRQPPGSGEVPDAEGCAPVRGTVEVAPGSRVVVSGSSNGTVELRRFVRDADPQPATVTVPPGGTELRMPTDPPGVRGELPYRVDAPDGVELAVCPG